MKILFLHVSLCKLYPLELRLTDSFKMNGLWPQDLPVSAPPLVLGLMAVLHRVGIPLSVMRGRAQVPSPWGKLLIQRPSSGFLYTQTLTLYAIRRTVFLSSCQYWESRDQMLLLGFNSKAFSCSHCFLVILHSFGDWPVFSSIGKACSKGLRVYRNGRLTAPRARLPADLNHLYDGHMTEN